MRPATACALAGLLVLPLWSVGHAAAPASFSLFPATIAKDGTPSALVLTTDGLLANTMYDLRVAVRNANATGALKVPSHYWSYANGDWRYANEGTAYFVTNASGAWRGLAWVRVNTASTNYDEAIRTNATSMLSVSTRETGTGPYDPWTDLSVLLLDMDGTTSGGTPGGWIDGYAYLGGNPVQNATVVVRNATAVVAVGTTQDDPPLVYGPGRPGYFRVAVPAGTGYTVEIWDNAMQALLLSAAGVSVTAGATTQAWTPVLTAAERSLLVAEAYADSVLDESGGWAADEYVRLHNPSTSSVSLAWWALEEDGGSLSQFPAGAAVPPLSSLYVAHSATAFRRLTGFLPDFEYGEDAEPNVPNMVTLATFPLTNTGDALLLRRPSGEVIDVLAYGNEAYGGPGWQGSAAPAARQGFLLRRVRDEGTWSFVDTNTSADWTTGARPRPGQTELPPTEIAFAGRVTPFLSPDNAYGAVSSVIDDAANTLNISLYQFESLALTDRVLAAVDRGVDVRLLLEGDPVNVTDAQRYVRQRIASGGGHVRCMIDDSAADIDNRYNYLHAKYFVADGNVAVVMTENAKESGLPSSPVYGNRGWGIVIENQDVAAYFDVVFRADWSTDRADLVDFSPTHPKCGGSTTVPAPTLPDGDYHHPYPLTSFSGDFLLRPILAPDHTLLRTGGILQLLSEATSSVDIEQFYAHHRWTIAAEGLDEPNAYLDAAINASRRGARVRLLLDATWYNVDEEDPLNNAAAVAYVNGVAAAEGLDLSARLADAEAIGVEKVHLKGMVVDHRWSLVSSVNWNRHSPTFNREVGVALRSEAVAAYYERAFANDWNLSTAGRLPGVDVSLSPDSVEAREKDRLLFTVTVANLGNARDTITLSFDVPGDWQGDLGAQAFVLDPGGTATTTLTVIVGRGGGPMPVLVRALASGEVGDEATATVRLPTDWLPWMLLVIAILAVIAFVPLLWWHRRRPREEKPPEPPPQ